MTSLPLFTCGEDLLSVQQFTRESLDDFFELAEHLAPIAAGEQVCAVLDGAVMGSLFFEPSTRTRLSFESAFLRLGGEVVTTTGFTFSSMAKGESISDTARVVSGYCDTLVVRHPNEGSVAQFAQASLVPVINAGDGTGEHPSQALLDVFTLRHELAQRGRGLDGCHIAMIGDLKYGRTVHSLMKLMSLSSDVTFQLFAPPSLEFPEEIAEYARQRGHRVHIASSVIEAIAGVDVIYTTRVQRERISEEILEQAALGGSLLNREILTRAGSSSAIIMHPLPRDSRIDSYDLSTDVDTLPGLAIFKQTDNGVLVRMAIFLTALGCDLDTVKAAMRPASWRPARRKER